MPIPQGFNLIYGKNGSGKTSLLEAIYYLSLGRSFRNTTTSRIINYSTDKLSIFANLLMQNNQTLALGIERLQNSQVNMRIAGEDVHSIAELANLTPVQLINSYCYSLLDGGPVFRRKYLDWGIFYLSKDYLRVWRQFARVLKQRNAALQARCSQDELESWTNELINNGNLLNQARQAYFQNLLPVLTETVQHLLPDFCINLNYYPGWNADIAYETALLSALQKDKYLGYTQFGPHKADLKITANQVPAKDILSRGQQKLFVCGMILAQGVLLRNYINKKPIYLVDDLPAELDATSRSNLIALLSRQEAQVFITAIERHALDIPAAKLNRKVFHVEHGQITEMND